MELIVNCITSTVRDVTEKLGKLIERQASLHISMDIPMLLDQILLKLTEVQTGITSFIQDLTLASSGHVSSTLLSIPEFILIIQDPRRAWNFVPFFEKEDLKYVLAIVKFFLTIVQQL